MTRAERQKKAKKLRAEGLSYQKIADRLGVSQSTAFDDCTGKMRERVRAWRAANPERVRELDRKRNKAKQEWGWGECPQCGGHFASARRPDRAVCAECSRENRDHEAKQRCERFIALREEGLLNTEIAEQEETSVQVVATVFHRAHCVYGLTVPRSPYYWKEF